MLSLLKESWTCVQEELRRRAGDAAYDSWLQDLRPVLMERGVVYLEAKSRLQGDRVRALFRPLLQEVLSGEIGVAVQVELQAQPDGEPLDELEVSPLQPVIDDSNRTAFLVLKSLATGKPLPGNQFFFHGPAGVGKTFLLRWWQETHPQRPMAFDLPALTKAFQAVHFEDRVGELQAELLRDAPLVLDEVHRIAGKEKLQRFVCDVLRQRERMKAPTVLASRWHPKEVRDLDASLATTFLAGFVAKIDPPSPLGRLRYLRALVGAPSRNGRAEEVEGIAQQVAGGYRELRAAWIRARDGHAPAGSTYLELIDPGRTFARLRDRVCERLGLDTQALLGKGQGRQVSMARKVLAFLCVQEGLSRAEVGRYLGQRSRAAVSYMTRSLASQMAKSPAVRELVEGML